ncbi:MAG: hypothetical protein IH984_05845 [Planctomycetes bacterium]|nr:hypothetical protein [Planctomycetota bacterium]
MSSVSTNSSKVRNNATSIGDSLSLSLVVVGNPICSEGLSTNVRDGMRIINRGRRVDGPISPWSVTQGRLAIPDSMPRGVVAFCERPCPIAFNSRRGGMN